MPSPPTSLPRGGAAALSAPRGAGGWPTQPASKAAASTARSEERRRIVITLVYVAQRWPHIWRSLPSFHAVSKETDRAGEVARAVPLHQHAEIVVDQQRRPFLAAGTQDRRREVARRQRTAVRAPHAQTLPLAQRFPDAEAEQGRVKAGRQAHRAPQVSSPCQPDWAR